MKHKIDFIFDYVFPTFILPNGTMPELGVINYLSSMHSTRAQNATLFEQQVSLGEVFDGELGGMPNSGTGYFYQAQVYKSILDYQERALYLSIPVYTDFIYPIKPNAIFNQFTGVNTGQGNRLNGEYFWKYISKKAMELIKEGRATIFLDYSMEPYIDKDTYLALHECLRHSDIPTNSIILCVNSFNAQQCYETWFPEEERKLKVRNLPFCYDHSSWYYADALETGQNICMNEQDFLATHNTIRKNHFLMKIRNGRSQRLAFLYKMATDNLLKLGDWSFLLNSPYNEVAVDATLSHFNFTEVNLETVKQLHDTAPHFLQSEQHISQYSVNAWTDVDFQSYSNCYFEICFETFIHGEYKSLTEKVFKPLVNYSPFLLVAYPGALKLLRELGFKTFSPYINESYDEIEDTNLRLQALYAEITRLCSMTKEELHAWYWGMKDILIHNHNHLLQHHKKGLLGENLLKELSNTVNKIV
jgi:hypothetical protein